MTLCHIDVEGIVRIRELPIDCTEEDFRAWWPRLTEKERDRYTVQRFHNLVTTNGKSTILNFMATLPASVGATITVNAFGATFALGTGVVTGIFASDTGLFGQVINKPITASSVSSPQIDYSTYFAPSDFSNAIVTNGGLYGGVSGTQLMTHFACTYSKGSLPFTFDYLINIS